MAKISFTLDKNGGLQTKVTGAEGKGCEVLTKAFDDALGTRSDRTYEPEFHQEEGERVSE